MTEADILKFTRRQVRYQLYRVRTEELGGPAAGDDAQPLREFYEQQPGFTHWLHFAERWDLDEAEGQHHRIVKRKMGEQAEWNGRLANLVVDITETTGQG